jgi:hypothetical protein
LRVAAVTVSVLTFAIITTGGLHWFTSPYVHQLLYNDKTDVAKVQTLRFFGGTKWLEFPVSDVEAPTGYHPLASFKVRSMHIGCRRSAPQVHKVCQAGGVMEY